MQPVSMAIKLATPVAARYNLRFSKGKHARAAETERNRAGASAGALRCRGGGTRRAAVLREIRGDLAGISGPNLQKRRARAGFWGIAEIHTKQRERLNGRQLHCLPQRRSAQAAQGPASAARE